MRYWTGIALLAGSWLFGVEYYQPAAPHWWALLVALGVGGLIRDEVPSGGGRRPWFSMLLALLLVLPACLLPWPGKALCWLFSVGLILQGAPAPAAWPGRLGLALQETAIVLFAQALALWFYSVFTACSHELPAIAAKIVELIARLLGIDATYTGRDVALFSMRKVHLLGATWELVLDPVTLGFVAGGVTGLLVRRTISVRKLFRLVLMLVAWLPLRTGLLIAVFLHRALLTDYDAELRLMNQFWNPWVLLALNGPLLALAARYIKAAPDQEEAYPGGTVGHWLGALIAVAGGALLCAGGVLWDPVGQRKAGRVLIDEFHSTWEPTGRPFDTEWYGHEAGYNYACIYDYCSRFYEMARLTTNISDRTLAGCDVLILKVPTAPYAPDEIQTLLRFVENGGGLMLIGEHTDVFMTSSHLNEIAAHFGFEFRKDCLFGIRTPFEQEYRAALVPHPIVQWIPAFDFAVSCSIHPRGCRGRAVMRNAGLWSLPADYHASNFYPQVEDRAEARYGAFIQLWAARRGAGRVVAFTDSTVFSNFSAFEPGRVELMLGMLEWLNRRNVGFEPGRWLILLGGALLLAGINAGRRLIGVNAMAAGAIFGWTLALMAVETYNRAALPLPTPRQPLTLVVIDRTVSDAPLSKCGFIKAARNGFGIFEQWILRLGYFTSRRSGPEAFTGNALIFLQPNLSVPEEFKTHLVNYVQKGGKVLVLDSAINTNSTANSLLRAFGIAMDGTAELSGVLETPEGWPEVQAEAVKTVQGGTPLVSLAGQPVAAEVRFGKGIVLAAGFGSLFNDENMGVTTDVEPGPELRNIYEVQFKLLRRLVEDEPSVMEREKSDGDIGSR